MQRNERSPVPYADISRYVALVKAIGDSTKPYVMLVKSHGHPVAMTICRIEQRRLKLRLGYKTLFSPTLRCLSVSYGGILGQPSDESCKMIIGELMNALRRREADLVFLDHLRTDSPMYKVCKKASGFWSRGCSTLSELHWQTEIPHTPEELYSSVPNSRKRRWRRDVRQMEKIAPSEVKVICYRNLQDVGHLVDVACQIEKKTYKNGLEVGFASSSVLNRALLEQASEDGWMRAYVLYAGDEPCAFQFDLKYKGTQFTEHGSFDPRWSQGSPGIVLLIKVLEQLCE
ncbi:MAG: GNAT family N-acetyltransferase, partial [Planctomycetota bacterium]